MVALIQRRLFCTKISQNNRQHRLQWSVKQVTKSNFNDSLQEFKSHLSSSDFVAVSLQNTGSFSAAWHRISSFDTPETAYLKARRAADRFQLLQFAVCPFIISGSKLTAHPYNFQLFPRDELNIGMPSYSFSCQTSYLTAMARQGFDFNACIYDGISYLSRAQELVAKVRMGNPVAINHVMKPSSSPPTVADTVFVERVKSRVKHWKKACTDSPSRKTDEALIKSLRKLVLRGEQYGSRPCMTIDVCSERQVQLVLEMLGEFSDDLVALKIPTKGGGTQAVRVVLTTSKEDKSLFERELQKVEEEQNKKLRGFREVIDLISASQKPVVSHNSLNDFSVIHSKFIAPLPLNLDEFLRSLHSVFPHIFDVNHLMKEVGPPEKVTNIPAAISYLKNRFFAPIDIEISYASLDEGKIHGQNVVRICHLFAKLCSVLKIIPGAIQSSDENATSLLDGYANVFKSCCGSSQESVDGGIRIWTKSPRKVGCEDLVFLWGFRDRLSAGMLKSLLQGSHDLFSEEFDVCLIDKSCAIVVFLRPNLSQALMDLMCSEGITGSLRELVSEGLRAAGYETYKRACSLGLWETDLACSLDKASATPDCFSQAGSETKSSEISWCNDLMINLDDL
ncbi:poly(A)-specific ribonuclease PARN-like isoform X2 [Durio zibethinus]|uniref:Poly(A)-specific ribonuclease PARN-like isoform X2 n=1 Tax=Durio zibethinus TaxID=66656 RepID=A0A6P5XJG4_DURZI|nr:poly(A)-specific ribonuclease PARN-like isoform X2 [Durio zibethinus]